MGEDEIPDIDLKKVVNQGKQEVLDQQTVNINDNMAKIKHKIVVISGKGGVGKTTVAVNLAMSLASVGLRVGILDVDITGPNVTKMLGIAPEVRPRVDPDAKKFYPVDGPLKTKVVSMAFLIENSDTPVIWRGPMKMSAVRQFLGEAVWGDLDYLICDLPPGTSDETVVVSTPQEVALMDARKTIVMAKTMKRHVIGIIENMSGFKCPHCSEYIDLYPPGGAEKASKDFDITFLGQIPFEVEVGQQGDQGLPFILKYPESASTKAFKAAVSKIREELEK
ncbi:MAG: Mrp/NBP35 family ATP-binding protein [Promethearchaeota archaeon]